MGQTNSVKFKIIHKHLLDQGKFEGLPKMLYGTVENIVLCFGNPLTVDCGQEGTVLHRMVDMLKSEAVLDLYIYIYLFPYPCEPH